MAFSHSPLFDIGPPAEPESSGVAAVDSNGLGERGDGFVELPFFQEGGALLHQVLGRVGGQEPIDGSQRNNCEKKQPSGAAKQASPPEKGGHRDLLGYSYDPTLF